MLNTYQKEFNDWVIYQIYPRSFKDSNGDGIGDLNGITQKLDYLKDLGVNAIWLSPCYKSPNADNGYDISDYYDIMDDFGTMEDFKRMITQMHARGIKLIMDYVANHTSSEHKWFKEARKSKDNPYRDYYYWADQPLNDWKSDFGGSAWEYDERTEQYYLHTFAVEQPDLNWENPKVREEMIKVIDFWVDLGVDGFRCDVLDRISKDMKCTNVNGPRLHEYINMIFGREKVKHIFTVGECRGATINNIAELVDGDRGELSTVFQFECVKVGVVGKYLAGEYSLNDLRRSLVKWQNVMQDKELLDTLFFENHDLPRIVSRFGDEGALRYESASMLATMLYLQKGVPFIYQGQEIGAINHKAKDINEFNDIAAINFYHSNLHVIGEEAVMERLNQFSRDTARHPMPWSTGEHSGFGSGKPWIGVCDSYQYINVETDLNSDKSVATFYKELFSLRKKYRCVRHGRYDDVTCDRDNCYIYRRFDENEEIWVICNFEKENRIDIPIDGEILLTNYGRNRMNTCFKPYEIIVLKKK